MNTAAIIFDKDGTLLDFDALWVPVAASALRKFRQSASCEAVPLEKLLCAIGVENGVTSIRGALCYGTYGDIARCVGEVLAEYGYACEEKDLIRWTTEAFHDSVTAGTVKPTCDALPQVLAALRAAGLRLALVTSDDSVVTAECLRQLNITSCFDVLYTDDGTHPCKPDPYLIHAFCECEGVKRSQVVMVGDTLTDMEFAHNGGIFAVGLAKTGENREILREKADLVLSSLTELLENLP